MIYSFSVEKLYNYFCLKKAIMGDVEDIKKHRKEH